MSSAMTKDQQKAFQAEMVKYDLKASDALPNIDTSNSGSGLTLSADPNQTDQAPSGWLMATNIQHLKDQIGINNADIASGNVTDQHITYPPAASAKLKSLCHSTKDGCELESVLNTQHRDEKSHVAAAQLAFVMGHSDKVKEYETAINTISFPKPMTVPVFSAENVVVKKGAPLKITGDNNQPVIVNFGSVTIEEGAEIIVTGGAIKWTSQSFTQDQ
ncbi:hypothetical protein MNBD_GAMMA12-232 [hydrothermal vent metagenome]|uniref:Uncharacterized protein n=1 Tax=hydrothermal vent metagenome TaxID=652676 RepID=A0A3B0Z000_9ZZZZ